MFAAAAGTGSIRVHSSRRWRPRSRDRRRRPRQARAASRGPSARGARSLGVGGEFGGDNDLAIVDVELGVVTLQRRLAAGAHDARVVVGGVDDPGRDEHRLVRLDRPGPPRPVGRHPAHPPRVIGGVRCVVKAKFFFRAPAGLKEPIAAVLGDRACLSLPFGVERAGRAAVTSGNSGRSLAPPAASSWPPASSSRPTWDSPTPVTGTPSRCRPWPPTA
jgi:hypothetical protein